jgi:site-specific DNA-methyltransferase (adenine-specific)
MSKIYTTESAAEFLGITPSRVRQLIMEGKLQSEKHGRDHLIQESAIKKYLMIGEKKTRKRIKK